MPVIDIQSYNIDFSVLDDNNPETLIILDKSTYLDIPEKPLLDITLPGYTGYLEVPYTPNKISLYNSDSLGLTTPSEGDCIAQLPDGVYQINMKICPYDQFFTNRCYLKSSQFNISYQILLLTFDQITTCYNQQDLKYAIIDLDILIQSAKAEADRCNVERATYKYNAAVSKLASINRKLNCQ